jgi:hypothetical protein
MLVASAKWSPAARRALAALGHVDPRSLVLALFGLILLNLSASGIYTIIDEIIEYYRIGWLPRLLPLAVLAVFVIWLFKKGQRMAVQTPSINVNPLPCPARALVILLSAPDRPTEDMKRGIAAIEGSLIRGTDIPIAVEQIARNWRMPLEAIVYHYGVLERIIFVTSHGPKGSQACVPILIDLIERLDLPRSGERLVVQTADQFLERDEAGIDFADAMQVFETVQLVTRKLLALVGQGRQIALDVTGGLKPTSIMMAAVSLLEDTLCFQYVDIDPATQKARVQSFDVTYRLDETY